MTWIALINKEWFGLALILVFALFIGTFALIKSTIKPTGLRLIPGLQELKKAIERSVEEGKRLHVSLGVGGLNGLPGASVLVGLSMLFRLARTAATGDCPPVATSGDGTVAILSQDVQQTAYRETGAQERYTPISGQLSGLTPWSFAAGTLPVIFDQNVSASVLVGHFGSEVALLADASERNGNQLFAGSDSLSAQAILYAAVQNPLVGEELYAGGAYLGAGKIHIASLRAQDAFRWLLIITLLAGAVLKFTGWL